VITGSPFALGLSVLLEFSLLARGLLCITLLWTDEITLSLQFLDSCAYASPSVIDAWHCLAVDTSATFF
jgi:hypothetical protein